MQSVFMDLPRQKADDKDLKILCNPEILFPQRIYPSFGPDLKRCKKDIESNSKYFCSCLFFCSICINLRTICIPLYWYIMP